jgi:hypothetical protein
MILNGNAVNITAVGFNSVLDYFWASNGSSIWHPETIAGENSAFFSPTMILNGNTVDVTAANGRAGLILYSAVNGSTTWQAQTVAPNGSLG